MSELRKLDSAEELEAALAADLALIYKHSPRCAQSWFARSRVDRFLEANPGVEGYVIDVIGNRELSAALAVRVGVGHESPQAILLQRGRPIWHASHGGIRGRDISAALSRRD